MTHHRIPTRAYSPEEKREICDRLYTAWCQTPHQRFGQLLMNVLRSTLLGRSLFNIEDCTLAEGIEKWVKETRQDR